MASKCRGALGSRATALGGVGWRACSTCRLLLRPRVPLSASGQRSAQPASQSVRFDVPSLQRRHMHAGEVCHRSLYGIYIRCACVCVLVLRCRYLLQGPTAPFKKEEPPIVVALDSHPALDALTQEFVAGTNGCDIWEVGGSAGEGRPGRGKGHVWCGHACVCAPAHAHAWWGRGESVGPQVGRRMVGVAADDAERLLSLSLSGFCSALCRHTPTHLPTYLPTYVPVCADR